MSSPLHDDGPSAPHGHTEVLEAEPAAASGPLAGDPSILGLPTFIVGSVFLGLTLVGYTPAESVGSALPVLIFATGLGQLITTIWAAALGQSAVAAVFGIFTGFWLSYSALLVGLIHGWWGISADPIDTQTVPAFLISWLVVIGALTIFTLRLPAAFTAVFALVEVALALVLIGALSGETIFATLGGIAVFAFAAIGVYLFASAASLATGGPAMNLGKPIQH
jgi:succinate-acetate transporter protein